MEQDKKLKFLQKYNLGKSPKWLVENAKKMGKNYENLNHYSTEQFKNHVIKSHSDPVKEKENGQVPIKRDDLDNSLLKNIIDNPKYAILGALRNNKEALYYTDGKKVLAQKVVNDTTNEQDIDEEGIYNTTFFKRKKPFKNEQKFWNTVGMNPTKTDMSKAKLIVDPIGTGGNPGGTKTVANPIKPRGQLFNINISQLSPEVKHYLDEGTKHHVKSLFLDSRRAG